MKIFIVAVLGMFLLSSCNSNLRKMKLSKGFSISDLVLINKPLLEPSEKIKKILDTVIIATNECVLYKNEPISFITTLFKDSENKIFFSIENTTKRYEIDCTKSLGIFYYKGYEFIHNGIIEDSLFRITDKNVDVLHVGSDKLTEKFVSEGEFFHSSWDYLYTSQKFKCIAYNNCNVFWYDDKHISTE